MDRIIRYIFSARKACGERGDLDFTYILPFILFAATLAVILSIMRLHREKGDARSEYLYRKDQGVYYFDSGKLLLNVPYPYHPRAVSLEEIDHLIFAYDIFSMETGTFTVGIDIVKRDGTTITGPGFVIEEVYSATALNSVKKWPYGGILPPWP